MSDLTPKDHELHAAIDRVERYLEAKGLPAEVAIDLVLIDQVFEKAGGVRTASAIDPMRIDDPENEFRIVAAYYVATTHWFNMLFPACDWCQHLQVAHLYFFKLVAQTLTSLDLLLKARCYSDAMTVWRTLLSKVSLFLLFTLHPPLYQDWLRHSDYKRYRDGEVRNELRTHGIMLVPHLYREASEVVHGQYLASAEHGYFEMGLFNDIPSISARIFNITKLLLGVVSFAYIQSTDHDAVLAQSEARQRCARFADALVDVLLSESRAEHLSVAVPIFRHWREITQGHFEAEVGIFDWTGYVSTVREFHKPNGQGRKLSPQYHVE